MRKYIPDMITRFRIAGAAAPVFPEAPQMPFLTVYALCGEATAVYCLRVKQYQRLQID